MKTLNERDGTMKGNRESGVTKVKERKIPGGELFRLWIAHKKSTLIRAKKYP